MWDWDEGKRQRTLRDRGVDFAAVERFDFGSATIDPDIRQDYGEVRLLALGLIDGRLHALVFTRRNGVGRVISLRRANAREHRTWQSRQN